MNKFTLGALFCLLLFTSCGTTQKISYFQDVALNDSMPLPTHQYITIQPRDMISIVVSSKDPQLAALFNLPRIQQTMGQPNLQFSNQNGQVSGYTVDSRGMIDFPVLGELKVANLKREEVAALVKNQLTGRDLVKDPVVTVDFLNLSFSLLGEVAKPGLFAIQKDQITLLEALSMGGDLTIYGKRDRVFVTREVDGKRFTSQVDLRSTDVFNSPVFYLQQNDIVYVEPNSVRANQSTVNGNNVMSVSLWMSIASLLTTISVLIFK